MEVVSRGNRTGFMLSGVCALLLPVLLAVLSTAGCSDDDDDDTFLDARVVDLFFDDDTLRVGEATVVRVQFSFSSDDVFDDGEHIVVVIQLPPGAAYRQGTGEIQSLTGDDNVGAQILDCPVTGEQYLLFDLDENDLDDAENVSGDADAELSLTVEAASPGSGTVHAVARNNAVFFACGEPFFSDRQALLTVVP